MFSVLSQTCYSNLLKFGKRIKISRRFTSKQPHPRTVNENDLFLFIVKIRGLFSGCSLHVPATYKPVRKPYLGWDNND